MHPRPRRPAGRRGSGFSVGGQEVRWSGSQALVERVWNGHLGGGGARGEWVRTLGRRGLETEVLGPPGTREV